MKKQKPLLYLIAGLFFGVNNAYCAEMDDSINQQSQNSDVITFSLIILEKGNGSFIKDATVVLDDSDVYSNTNAAGLVTFHDVDPPKSVKVLAQGYQTTTVAFASINPRMEIFIPPISVEGEGLKVVADRLKEKASKIVLNSEELSHTPGSQGDPILALTSLPGIVPVSDGGGEIYMRGSGKFDNITVVDRVPIGYLYHFGGLRSTINPLLVSDLNVYLSGFPVDYQDVLGGVIDVHLRAPKKDQNHYNINISTIESNFLIEGPVSATNDSDSYYIAARRSYIDLLLSPADFSELADNGEGEANRIITVPRFNDGQALYRHDYQNGHLDYYYFTASDKIELDVKKDTKIDPNLAGRLSSESSYQTVGFTWNEQLQPTWNIDMPLFRFSLKQILQLGQDENGLPYFADTVQHQYSILPKLTWHRNATEEFSFGTSFHYFEVPIKLYIPTQQFDYPVDPPITDLEAYSANTTLYATATAGYIKQRKQWTDRLTSIVGIRATRATISGGAQLSSLTPRAGIEYQLSTKTLLTANIGEYVQSPLGFEIIKGIGNPQLEYTEAQHRTLGMQYKINNLWSSKLEIYQKTMDKLVVPVGVLSDNPPDPPDNYANEGSGKAYGIDLFIKRERRNGTMGWVSYSYAKSERTDENDVTRDFSGDQPHTITLVWGQDFDNGPFQWMRSWKDWNWGIKINAHAGTPYTPIVGREQRDPTQDPNDPNTTYKPIYDTKLNSARTPTYFQMDLRIEKTILRNRSKSKLYIDILNVTNRKNVDEYDYGQQLEKIDNPDEVTGLPIFPFIGFETSF